MTNTPPSDDIIVTEFDPYRNLKILLLVVVVCAVVTLVYVANSRPAEIIQPTEATDIAPLKFSAHAEWDESTARLFLAQSTFGDIRDYSRLRNIQVTVPQNMANQVNLLRRSASSELLPEFTQVELYHRSVDSIMLPHLTVTLGQLSVDGPYGANWLLFKQALDELDAIITNYKRETDTALPVHYDDTLRPLITGTLEPSLPSRSVARAQLVALLSTMIESGQTNVFTLKPEYEKLVDLVQENNVKARFEFPIDGVYGKEIANAYFADISAQPVFQSMVYHARVEWWNGRGLTINNPNGESI